VKLLEDELEDLRDRNQKLKQKLNRFKMQADELKKVKMNFNSLIDELEDFKAK
jgi:prefoldin subunit 5